MLIVINRHSFQYNTPSFFVFCLFRSFIQSFFVWVGKENTLTGKSRDCVIFKCSLIPFTEVFCVFSSLFEIKTMNKTRKKPMEMMTIFSCVALIKIIIFRLLSNPSREWEIKLCNSSFCFCYYCWFVCVCEQWACVFVIKRPMEIFVLFFLLFLMCAEYLLRHMIHIKSSK